MADPELNGFGVRNLETHGLDGFWAVDKETHKLDQIAIGVLGWRKR
jgi:hypothetical protein